MKNRTNYIIHMSKAEAERMAKESGVPKQNRGRHCKTCNFTRYYRITHEEIGPIWICARCFQVTRRITHLKRKEDLNARGLNNSSLEALSKLMKQEKSGKVDDEGWITGTDLHGQTMQNLVKRKLVKICYKLTPVGEWVVGIWEGPGPYPHDWGY